ncbi:MAG: hypothetical protein ACR2GR_01480 [Rhodothermales bacterium]
MRLLVLIAFCVSAAVPASAQQTTHALFGEVLGSGGAISANYEFAPGRLALRAGVGWMPFAEATLPITAAYRLGRRGRMMVGGGVLVAPRVPTSPFSYKPSESAVLLSGLLAYRWDVPRGSPKPRRFAQVAFTPLLNVEEGVFVPWIGVAAGIRLGR